MTTLLRLGTGASVRNYFRAGRVFKQVFSHRDLRFNNRTRAFTW